MREFKDIQVTEPVTISDLFHFHCQLSFVSCQRFPYE